MPKTQLKVPPEIKTALTKALLAAFGAATRSCYGVVLIPEDLPKLIDALNSHVYETYQEPVSE